MRFEARKGIRDWDWDCEVPNTRKSAKERQGWKCGSRFLSDMYFIH